MFCGMIYACVMPWYFACVGFIVHVKSCSEARMRTVGGGEKISLEVVFVLGQLMKCANITMCPPILGCKATILQIIDTTTF